MAKPAIAVSPLVVTCAALDVAGAYAQLETQAEGLTSAEAAARLLVHGPNVLSQDRPPGALRLLGRALIDPLVILLAVLSAISAASGDLRAAAMMALMIALSVGLRLVQETRAGGAAAKLKAMITLNATVVRDDRASLAEQAFSTGWITAIVSSDRYPRSPPRRRGCSRRRRRRYAAALKFGSYPALTGTARRDPSRPPMTGIARSTALPSRPCSTVGRCRRSRMQCRTGAGTRRFLSSRCT